MTALSTKLPPTHPMGDPSAGSQLPQAIPPPESRCDTPAEPPSPASFDASPIHDVQESPDANDDSAPVVAPRPDSPSAAAMEVSTPTVAAWRLADAILLLRAEALTDLEATRIANENRLRALVQDYGLTEGPEHAAQADLVAAMGKLEHQAELELKRALRKHPLGAWVKATQGVGEKQGARLIASIGDPYWHSVQNRPRLVSELWAYAGLHVLHPGRSTTDTQAGRAGVQPDVQPGHVTSDAPHGIAGLDQTSVSHKLVDPHTDHAGGPTSASHTGADIHTSTAGGSDRDTTGVSRTVAVVPLAGGVAPRRMRGQKANWNSAVKMRAFLVAESCIKKRDSPYRTVYDAGREKYADAVHNHPCHRCGPAGKPAQPGSPLSAGHQHARAMRLVMKTLLRDLWAESKRLHEERSA